MKWVTREGARVDRIACPWLIRKFIDPAAEFIYVAPARVAEAAAAGAIPYDVGGAELGHRNGNCSFESIIQKYGLRDPALDLLAKIVHGADIEKDLRLSPEAPGLKAIADGFALLYGTRDHEKLAAETPVYDALYEWCRAQTATS